MEKQDKPTNPRKSAKERFGPQTLSSYISVGSRNSDSISLDCFKLKSQYKASPERTKSTLADESGESEHSSPAQNKTTPKGKKVVIKNPVIVSKENTNDWTNFQDTCKRLNRPEKHFRGFIAEQIKSEIVQTDSSLSLPVSCSTKVISKVLTSYISKFVTCRSCRGANTEFVEKESEWFKHCLTCGFDKPLKAHINKA